jgi:hypothetical protein
MQRFGPQRLRYTPAMPRVALFVTLLLLLAGGEAPGIVLSNT